MKKLFAFAALTLFAIALSAQVEKNVIYRVATGKISYTEPMKKKETVGSVLGSVLTAAAGSNTTQHPEFAEQVRSAIIGGIGNTRRLRVIDGQFVEGEIGETETAFYIDGNISSISVTSKTETTKDSNGKSHTDIKYRGNITATILLKDANTDIVVRTININTGEYSLSWIESGEKALGNAISRMRSGITATLNNAFPLYAQVIEGSTAKKDKQKEVYIDLGAKDAVYKGMTFNVYKVKNVAGKEAKTEIGRLKISEVEGDDVSLCKVTKGGTEIKSVIDAGATLLIMSRE